MKQGFKALSLLLLLMAAQQGAVVHELGHVLRAGGAALKVEPGGVADSTCALCPAFAQVVTPAVSHAFHVPVLIRGAAQPGAAPLISSIEVSVPRPRSRGPPSLS